jgi:hypothetical protein
MRTIEEHRANIQHAIRQKGQYTHNLISMTLRMVASEYGYAEANKLVDEFKLTRRFGIPKVEELP